MCQAILKSSLFIKCRCAPVLLIVLLSCKQEKQTGTFSNQLLNRLEACSKRKSIDGNFDGFKYFFEDWNKSIEQNKIEIIDQNDTVHNIFEVYRLIYRPFELPTLGAWEGENRLNSSCEYAVIQNKIFYSVIPSNNLDDFDWKKSKRDSIVDFRPPIELGKDKILYLTSDYQKALRNFLGTESTDVGEENLMHPSIPEGESADRYLMLRPYIPIIHGHWGRYWHLETHPYVSIIILNKTMTKAKIDFRVGYEGGEAILEKDDNSWTIKESKSTWVE